MDIGKREIPTRYIQTQSKQTRRALNGETSLDISGCAASGAE